MEETDRQGKIGSVSNHGNQESLGVSGHAQVNFFKVAIRSPKKWAFICGWRMGLDMPWAIRSFGKPGFSLLLPLFAEGLSGGQFEGSVQGKLSGRLQGLHHRSAMTLRMPLTG